MGKLSSGISHIYPLSHAHFLNMYLWSNLDLALVCELSSPNALQSVRGANNCGFVHQGPGIHCQNIIVKLILPKPTLR